MARSVLAAAAIVCLTALSAAAQITNNYWLSIPPATGQTPPKPPPAPEIPDVPFAPARNVRLAASIGIDKGFRPAGLWAPLWLGPQMVALPGTLHGGIALMAWYADRFNRSRVIADTSTVRGAAILDMALSRDGKRLAIAAAAGDKLQIWTRDTQRDTPASLIAAIDGACDKAGVAWLGGDTLAVGARVIPAAPAPAQLPIVIQTQHTPAAAPQPKHIVDIVQSAREQQPQSLALDCLADIDPWTLIWSPDARYAVAQGEERGKWTLIDRARNACTAIDLPAIAPVAFIDWQAESRSFLFTATPARSPDPAHIGVMEYTLASHQARLLASPAAAASYIGRQIAVLGSQRMNVAAIAANPGALWPAEIAWIDPARSQVNIVPTGFTSTAAQLLHAHLSYSPIKGMLAASFQTPNPKGAFTVLLWIAAVARNGGVLGTGKMGAMLESWAPDGSRLAVLAGLPAHPTLAIVPAPQ